MKSLHRRIPKATKGNSYYYLNNAHGDVTALINSTGDIVNSYKYDAFGNTVESVENIQNRFRYAGEQFDPVTGQYYLRARFYNPIVGRFTQEDTYRGDGLNLYSYVQNNPVKYIDPSGYSCESKKMYILELPRLEVALIEQKPSIKLKTGLENLGSNKLRVKLVMI